MQGTRPQRDAICYLAGPNVGPIKLPCPSTTSTRSSRHHAPFSKKTHPALSSSAHQPQGPLLASTRTLTGRPLGPCLSQPGSLHTRWGARGGGSSHKAQIPRPLPTAQASMLRTLNVTAKCRRPLRQDGRSRAPLQVLLHENGWCIQNPHGTTRLLRGLFCARLEPSKDRVLKTVSDDGSCGRRDTRQTSSQQDLTGECCNTKGSGSGGYSKPPWARQGAEQAHPLAWKCRSSQKNSIGWGPATAST